MSRFLRFFLSLFLIATIVFAFKRASEINAQKIKVPQNNPQRKKILQVADYLYQPGSARKLKALFPDIKQTSFDPLGNGEGPIDYLYSPLADTTFLLFHYPDTLAGLEDGRVVYSSQSQYNNH